MPTDRVDTPLASHTDPREPRTLPWSLLAFAIGVPAAVLLVLGLARPDLQIVEHVVIDGAERAGAAGLRHLADVPNGTSVWTVDVLAAAAGVKQHPWVRDVHAQFEWPATVHLTVTEHRPVALMAGSAMYYVCEEGLVVAAASTDDLDYPVITGITQDLGARHPELPIQVAKSALLLLDKIDNSGVMPRDRVGEINFSETRGFTVYVQDGPRILFELDGFDRQVSRLVQLVDQGVDLNAPLHIDLAPATVAIVRPLKTSEVEVNGGEG